jgi:hypothetical protein
MDRLLLSSVVVLVILALAPVAPAARSTQA